MTEPAHSIRVALYARVSTDTQDLENQFQRLRDHAKRNQWHVFREYGDVISGVKDNRPKLDCLLSDARAHRFDAVLAVRLDRLGRSVIHLLGLFQQLESVHVHFIALDQPIDTSTPMGRYLRVNLAAVAELEREFIRERTLDGLARAKRAGTKLGRPWPARDRKCRWCGGPAMRAPSGAWRSACDSCRVSTPWVKGGPRSISTEAKV